ncbi:Mu transposase domain-containing protein [Amycolatopsis coloradensis]|uniref:Mu transposase domain-containing protein n=1 Tax=Amycolatopsis coloradensis TaxID=76021 RepID=UPI001ABFD0D0|nr:hypothetical protein [Amycolatopsis coloradensis]
MPDAVNDKLAAADHAEDVRHIDQRVTTIGQNFALEAPLLAVLPVDEFDIALTTTPRVDRYARITVRQALCSVPARLIGQPARAKLDAEEVVVLHGSNEVARHPRLTTKGGQHFVLDQYLEVLAGKPGALRGSTARSRHDRRAGSPPPIVLGCRPRQTRRPGGNQGADRGPCYCTGGWFMRT